MGTSCYMAPRTASVNPNYILGPGSFSSLTSNDNQLLKTVGQSLNARCASSERTSSIPLGSSCSATSSSLPSSFSTSPPSFSPSRFRPRPPSPPQSPLRPQHTTKHRSPIPQSMPANSSSFQLQIQIRGADSGEPIAFKVDGERFEGGTRTIKFATNARYRIALTTRPAAEFHSFHLAGSDLRLHTDDLKSGEYCAEWNTTGINVCKKGSRENVVFTLQGPAGILKRQIQCKFYPNEDSHAEWGHKLKSLDWTCAVDTSGNISVTDENYK